MNLGILFMFMAGMLLICGLIAWHIVFDVYKKVLTIYVEFYMLQAEAKGKITAHEPDDECRPDSGESS